MLVARCMNLFTKDTTYTTGQNSCAIFTPKAVDDDLLIPAALQLPLFSILKRKTFLACTVQVLKQRNKFRF